MSGNEEKDHRDLAPTEEQIARADSSASSVISRTSTPEHLEDDVFNMDKQEPQLDAEQLSADVAARGIVNPNKFSGDVPQSGIRGMLIAACDIPSNAFNKSQEENGKDSDPELQEELSREKHVSSGTEELQPAPQAVSMYNKDSSQSRPSSASSLSSLATGINKREVSFQNADEDEGLLKERSFTHTENRIEVISICTQTEWSWLKDMELYQETRNRSKSEWAERPERKMSKDVSKSPSGIKSMEYKCKQSCFSQKKEEKLYCCPQYERFVKFELAQRSDAAHLADEMIDIKPHPPYGTKAARRAAKERAAERAREREMERQRAAGANPTNFYALTRQMKTITYSLASTKCMEEGWTVRPPSPSLSDNEQIQDPFVIEVNPLQLRKQTFLERFYENKKRFLLLLPDGTGTCFYPSGNIAVMITAAEKGKFTYIVFDDEEENESNPSHMLGIFEPSGHGTCYFRNGSIRLVLNPFFGVLLDKNGTQKKKWLWHNTKEHVHAPPFQPITFLITKQLSIRCLSQNKVVLTFNYGKHTARFNVGVKLKAVAKAKPPTSRDRYEMHLAEVKQFVNIVLDRAQNAIRLPNYPRLDKIPLPPHLQKARDAGRKARLLASTPSSQRETTVIVN
ncbi:Glutamate-rich protein 6 [Stylophora pistillata]|uniref:Glutamate-rich protein 6 n=1 Tax=Stylophora pistillata TaxID=50429 RepID=A0A2B4SB91_STYPI|nr:Glutamate-rich protein 6 [Stylophora pistillata]